MVKQDRVAFFNTDALTSAMEIQSREIDGLGDIWMGRWIGRE